MTENFVTYEQAITLKKLGFNEEVNHFYQEKELVESLADFSCEDYNNDYTAYENFNGSWIPEEIECSAPTLSQAETWFRRNKKLSISIITQCDKELVVYELYISDLKIGEHILCKGTFDSYEEALSAGITECLKLLEK